VHFAGESDHGWDLGPEGVFGPEDIRGALRDAVRRPRLVFSNSCYGGSPRGTELAGVAGAFMKSGATHVIGPAVRIDDDHAARFSELFYRYFFAAGGHSPAQGLLEARQSYIRTHPASTVPFLYRLFGDPRNHPAASGFMKKVPRFLVPAVAAVSIVAAALHVLLDSPFTPAQREVPHLKFLVSLGSSEHAVLKQIADSFGTAHGVSIEVVNEDPDTAAAMLNRGDSLDVASVDINRFARVRNPEILSDLSPRERLLLVQDPLIVSDRDAAPPGDTTPVFTWNLKERGKRLAVPFRLIVRLLFVKKSGGFGYLLDRDSSSPPATWQDLAASPAFRREAPEAPRLSIMAAGSDGGLFLWECIRAAGGDPAYLSSPAGIDVLQFCRRNLSDAYRADWRNASTLLRMHHVAAGWSWNIAFAALANHGMLADFEVLPGLAWDSTRPPFSLLGGEVLAVPRTCRNDSLAQEFIAFLLHPEIQRRLARQLFWIPVSGRVFNTVKDIYGPHVPIVEEALQYAHPLPPWWGPDIHSQFTRIFEACINRQAPPPADIARLFQPRLDSLLSPK